jgi:hypothetical protein
VPPRLGAQSRPGQQQAHAGRRRLHEEVEVGYRPVRDRVPVHQRLDRFPQGRAQPPQGPQVRQFSARDARPFDPPPNPRVAIRRQEIVHRGRSGRRDGIDEIHRDNRLADYGEAPASVSANGHIESIGIRVFYKCHAFFETASSLPRG